MTALQIPLTFSFLNKKSNSKLKLHQPIICYSSSRIEVGFIHENHCKFRVFKQRRAFLGERIQKEEIFTRKGNNEKRAVLVRFNQGFNFNSGGGKDDGNTGRVLGNLALAIGLTYLTMTGQLGWVLDTVVSISLLAVALPIIGLGAFLWFAGRDIVQDNCPNCGNDFQIFKSSLKDDLQLCPFCSQPFSVQGNRFVRESAKFSSKQSTTSGQAFNGFSPRTEKGKTSSAVVVDVEAEVKDID